MMPAGSFIRYSFGKTSCLATCSISTLSLVCVTVRFMRNDISPVGGRSGFDGFRAGQNFRPSPRRSFSVRAETFSSSTVRIRSAISTKAAFAVISHQPADRGGKEVWARQSCRTLNHNICNLERSTAANTASDSPFACSFQTVFREIICDKPKRSEYPSRFRTDRSNSCRPNFYRYTRCPRDKRRNRFFRRRRNPPEREYHF
jgi:hypothetical protein